MSVCGEWGGAEADGIGLGNPQHKWRLFFRRQAANPRYLQDGDVVTAAISDPDGGLDLGTQRTVVMGKAS